MLSWMKKGYYVHFDGKKSAGVAKKISMQMCELSRYFQMEEILVEDVKRSLAERVIGLLPGNSIPRNYEEVFAKIVDPDFIYIRRTVADLDYYAFLEHIRNTFPKCKIIVEIFTYPYSRDEFLKWNAWPFYFKELIVRPRLKKVIDRFVTYTKDGNIFGIPTIQTINGIDVSGEKLVDSVKKDSLNNVIDLIAVAIMRRQHGYEWVIKGLHTYYQRNPETEVRLHLVGDGPEKKKYVKLVRQYRLNEHVKIYGTVYGEKLDQIYAQADIALAAFGMYKLKVNRLSALKTREYLAKGLPIATGCPIDVFEETEVPYVCNFTNEGKEIDIFRLVRFYQELQEREGGRANMIKNIRSFAEKTVDMKKAMAPVVSYILEEDEGEKR